MKILIIEDYKPILESVKQLLEEEGFSVDYSTDGEDGLWKATRFKYDTLILDLMLPKKDGLEILKIIRKKGINYPVLILTAKDSIDDIVKGLENGADDYLVKPFALEELLARVKSLIRRYYNKPETEIKIKGWILDTNKKVLKKNDRKLHLTKREYDILYFLLMNKGKVISRQDIWQHLYPYEELPESNVIDVYINYLRKKLKEAGIDECIKTIRGFGYIVDEK